MIFRPLPTTLSRLVLPGDEVHVWTALLDPPPLPAAEVAAVLSEAERARRDRFAVSSARTQFAHTRGLLRYLLGAYLGRPPAELRFELTADGKPSLFSGSTETPIQFNLSHTAGLAAFAVAAVPVGVDVEQVRDMPNADGLVERYFTAAERERFRTLPAELRTAAFFRGWACKEAVLKGVGCGTRGLERCEVEIDPRLPSKVSMAPDGGPWALTCWEPADGYVGAVAVQVD